MQYSFLISVFGLLLVFLLIKNLFENFEKRDVSKIEKPPAFDKLLYRPRKFLTDSELKYFRILEEKYGVDYYIIPQVLLSSLVDVDLPRHLYAYKGYRSKIDKKTLDFVLFNKVSFAPVMAIELDDYTHQRFDRKIRDEFVNAVMEKVGLKIERIKGF